MPTSLRSGRVDLGLTEADAAALLVDMRADIETTR
jgi:hypothetical protein